ncbi:DNA repair protein REV1 [Acorus gramineus]|uniref:DNA repair protein REV1 n=1 Tax=Acorus gramineus TaxID=55184 RepID=A0AAV9BIC5_ACOGR|nr:DNA repair protein REV1 [Acorus gramineus]
MSFDSSRSKRSRGSNPSSSDRTNPSKQKKPRNRTLGPAWGANSISSVSSKSSSKRSPFANFGSYMEEKNRKLREQFDTDASTSSVGGGSSSGKGIFSGVSIFVDGFTVPSNQELRGYMLKHGGRFENYFSKSRVTHIICSNLPDSKVKNLRAFSRGLPVVKPTWVLDSVAADRLLSWIPYQLEQLVSETRAQQKLSSFFALKNISSIVNPELPMNIHGKIEEEGPLSKNDGTVVKFLSEVGNITKHGDLLGEDSSYQGQESSTEVRNSESSPGGESSVKESHQSSPNKAPTLDSNFCTDNKNAKESLDTTCSGDSIMRHSTLGDPNFIENYFKSSRLHFIGTWRNRYRKRFSSKMNGVKYGSCNDNMLLNSSESVILHVDMDCFFVSVVIRNSPELYDKPVAVCHSDNPKGTAEISSANYPARDYGVRAGMFVRDAKAHCPHLVIVPYNFEAYEVVADQFYAILHKHCNKVQAVSCDEAFLDVTFLEGGDPEKLASTIRQEIADTTGCTASAGIAGNLLVARLATRIAKPNGQCFIPSEKVDDYLKDLLIKALPGIGPAIQEKLKSLDVHNCGQLRMIPREDLQRDFGPKLGNMLWNSSRGIDNRMVSVVQVKKRRKGADEPMKYMGCGNCENISRSMTILKATDNANILQRIVRQLFGYLNIDVKEVRGIGLQISKLDDTDMSKQGHEDNKLDLWLASASDNSREQFGTVSSSQGNTNGDVSLSNARCKSILVNQEFRDTVHNSGRCVDAPGSSFQPHINQPSGARITEEPTILPPICSIDVEVLKSLPPEIISEINDMYSGRLTEFLEVNKMKDDKGSVSDCTTSYSEVKSNGSKAIHDLKDYSTRNSVTRNKGKLPFSSPVVSQNGSPTKDKGNSLQVLQTASTSFLRSSDFPVTSMGMVKSDLMPVSLSQVDASILQQLPEELKVDLLDLLPPHRPKDTAAGSSGISVHNGSENINPETSVDQLDELSCNLWMGDPPKWVEKFEVSNCTVLKSLVKSYYQSERNGPFSTILQFALSSLPHFTDLKVEGLEEDLFSLCELFKQYVQLKIDSDIEEIYICFRLLKRSTIKSEFLLEVYNVVHPFLQASMNENYGGNLQLYDGLS